MLAATAAGVYDNTSDAKNAMGSGFDAEYKPINDNVGKYEALYKAYSDLGDFVENKTNSPE
jgi:ribulose kinase